MKAIALAVLMSVGLPASQAMALTDVECQARWIEADADKDGRLLAAEAGRFADAMQASGKAVPADATGGVSAPMFLEHCKRGIFATAVSEPDALMEGANSFTEGQAQEQIAAAGLSNVSALNKDEKGIWRGTAHKSGKTVNVAVDYQGNVVAE